MLGGALLSIINCEISNSIGDVARIIGKLSEITAVPHSADDANISEVSSLYLSLKGEDQGVDDAQVCMK